MKVHSYSIGFQGKKITFFLRGKKKFYSSLSSSRSNPQIVQTVCPSPTPAMTTSHVHEPQTFPPVP